jgi:hypothetical protein
MVDTPKDKVPTGAVPEAGYDENDDDVANISLVSTQLQVDVVANEIGKSHVPPTPELARVGGEIGLPKISREIDTYQEAEADSHQ